ncbi:hypothetical protein ACE1CI_26965 [Aerosakkonemataceae cyanobacterium BLCC-F50]|uniref:DUF6888 domain-containing protein n=1 Tax=Floridaenema flaviceps BLCC-F50 TaxID=3153642 RepID=A0ABV4XY26_9CYAN
MPTAAQTLTCFILCQRLTNFYRPIFMVRLDRRINKIYILAGDETEIEIDSNGNWEYL